MLIHDNIKYLRESKNLSQQKFARKLGLKRGNIASYERSTMPSLETIAKIAEWYKISIDDLLKVNLSERLLWNKLDKRAVESDFRSRLKEVINYIGKNSEEFASSIKLTVNQLDELIGRKKTAKPEWKIGVLLNLANAYSWLSMEWLIRGEGTMVNSGPGATSDIAEPQVEYATAESMEAIEKLIEKLNGRILILEDKVKGEQ